MAKSRLLSSEIKVLLLLNVLTSAFLWADFILTSSSSYYLSKDSCSHRSHMCLSLTQSLARVLCCSDWLILGSVTFQPQSVSCYLK